MDATIQWDEYKGGRMFRSLIAPVQAWLLSQGQCVGCGMPIENGQKRNKKDGSELYMCKCGRGYMKLGEKKFRRARMSEM